MFFSPPTHFAAGVPARGRNTRRYAQGFTLVELIVTISIFVIISAITLFNYPSFSSRIALDNLAHEIALTVREAQVFGTSVREFGAGSGTFPGHGIYFATSDNTHFTLFADVDSDGFYGGCVGDVCAEQVDEYAMQQGHTLSQLCVYASPGGGCISVPALHITYVRPNPEAQIRDNGGSLYAYAAIAVSSSRGDTRTVEVWSNGQITVRR
ncbi:MAG: type II secretion system protein [Parcubacteria group bacterium]|nr:type II secretion system protein [Parcubacteria group bacterium]